MSAKKKAGKRSKAKTSTKKSTSKKQTARKKTPRKKATRTRRTSAASRPSRRRGSRPGLGSGAAGQSGDLQSLSRRERSDSESVEELLEEGNAFEADVVSGVEAADDADEQEVHTHEVPEDDVPGEYRDKD